MSRTVPFSFTWGFDSRNAAKAWLDGYDQAVRDIPHVRVEDLQQEITKTLKDQLNARLQSLKRIQAVVSTEIAGLEAEVTEDIHMQGWKL